MLYNAFKKHEKIVVKGSHGEPEQNFVCFMFWQLALCLLRSVETRFLLETWLLFSINNFLWQSVTSVVSIIFIFA